MSKDSRAGGKYTGSHTTLVPLARMACDIAVAISQVTKVSPGFIKAGLRSVGGHTSVKFIDEDKHCILLSVRDNVSHQEVRIYSTNRQMAKLFIARELRNRRVAIRFMNHTERS